MNGKSVPFQPWHLIAAGCALIAAALGVAAYSNAAGVPENSTFRLSVKDNRSRSLGHGSAFLVSGNDVLITNYHVVKGADSAAVQYSDDGRLRSIPATIRWYSEDQDLALIRTEEGLNADPVTLSSDFEATLSKRDNVTAIGFPGTAEQGAKEIAGEGRGFSDRVSALLDSTISTGTVQRFVDGPNVTYIQHSASIHPGSSGGPLFDGCHRVVGVNSMQRVALVALRNARTGAISLGGTDTLEYSVAVEDVISALRREDISYASSFGTCRMGMTGEMQLLAGGLAGGGLIAFLLLPLALRRQDDEPEMDFLDDEDSELSSGTLVRSAGFAGANEGKGFGGLKLTDLGSGRDYTVGSSELSQTRGVVIGRSGHDAQIELNDTSISRRHAELRLDARGMPTIMDLGSTNGLTVNGRAVAANQRIQLADRNVVAVGSVKMQLQLNEQHEINHALEEWRLSGFDSSGLVVEATVFAPDGERLSHQFVEICKIGRSDRNDLVIDENSVSRNHAVVGFHPELGISVRDLGSSNGTFVRGERVGAEPVSVAKVGQFRVGEVELKVTRNN